MAEINGGSLYELNKGIIKDMKPLKGKTFSKRKEDIIKPYFNKKATDYSYFMLLCNERRDYTVFNLCMGQHFFEDKVNDITEEFSNLIRGRGDVMSVEETTDDVALEVWIRPSDETEVYAYYLFPYDEGVIEV